MKKVQTPIEIDLNEKGIYEMGLFLNKKGSKFYISQSILNK